MKLERTQIVQQGWTYEIQLWHLIIHPLRHGYGLLSRQFLNNLWTRDLMDLVYYWIDVVLMNKQTWSQNKAIDDGDNGCSER